MSPQVSLNAVTPCKNNTGAKFSSVPLTGSWTLYASVTGVVKLKKKKKITLSENKTGGIFPLFGLLITFKRCRKRCHWPPELDPLKFSLAPPLIKSTFRCFPLSSSPYVNVCWKLYGNMLIIASENIWIRFVILIVNNRLQKVILNYPVTDKGSTIEW